MLIANFHVLQQRCKLWHHLTFQELMMLAMLFFSTLSCTTAKINCTPGLLQYAWIVSQMNDNFEKEWKNRDFDMFSVNTASYMKLTWYPITKSLIKAIKQTHVFVSNIGIFKFRFWNVLQSKYENPFSVLSLSFWM